MRPGIEERSRVLLLLRDWRDSSESRQREGRHQPTFAAEDPGASPNGGKTTLLKESAGEEPSGSSTWWRRWGAIFHVKKYFFRYIFFIINTFTELLPGRAPSDKRPAKVQDNSGSWREYALEPGEDRTPVLISAFTDCRPGFYDADLN
jgi:hypothetical protein